MTRIVKADAEQVRTVDPEYGCNSDFYYVSDTIEIKKGWNPKDYKELLVKQCQNYGCSIIDAKDWDAACPNCDRLKGFEAGFEACIEAMEKL